MKRLKRLAKGQGLVEFALILPILLIILLGIVEASLLIQGHLTVQHIARETARWAVTYQPLQGACLDADGDGVIADGIGLDGPDGDPYPDDDDLDDHAPAPSCPIGGVPDPLETDEDYYARRVQLIKQHALDASASLRVRRTATGLTEATFASNIDQPGFFGVRVWGFPSPDADCDDPVNASTQWSPANPNGCLNHPGLEGLPVMVHIQHNVEIIDPIYSIFGTHLTVQANSVMINEGIQIGMGDKPPTFGWSSTTSVGAIPPGSGGPTGCTRSLNSIAILGPTTGYTGTTYTFNSIASPVNATQPITYTWSPPPISGQGTSSAQYQWSSVGDHTITLTAVNCGGSDTDNHTITLEPPPSYSAYDITLRAYPENLDQVTNGWTDRCHDFVATVLLNGSPLENEWVSFRIEPPVSVGSFQYGGDDPSDTQVQTDVNGQAFVQLCGNDAGTAIIRAWLDIGSSIGVYEAGAEPSDTATKIWTFPVPPIPYLTVSRYDVVSGDRLEAYAMQHTASTQYGLFWCVITGTASVDTSQLLMLEGPPPTTAFTTDTNGDSPVLAFNVPVGSDGWYRLETRPITSSCTDGDPVAASPEIMVTAARPDLTVIDVISTTPMCPGNVYPVQVVIQNTTHGNTDGSAEVDFDIDPPIPPIDPVGDHKQWMPAVGPYEIYTMTTNVWFEDGGPHALWVRVDTGDRIEESDETNNRTMFMMDIGSAAYCEDEKTVVIPAQGYQEIEDGSGCGAGKSWVPSDVGGVPTMGTVNTGSSCSNSWDTAGAPMLGYTVNFTTTGVYHAYFRGESNNTTDDNSVWISVDGTPPSNCYRLDGSVTSSLTWDNGIYSSPGGCPGGSALAVVINTAGEHTIEVRMREDGYEWAKLMLIHEDRLALAPTGGSKPQARPVPVVRPRPLAQTVAWLENFSGLPNGTQTDWFPPTEWSTDLSGIPYHDYFEVSNNEFRAQDTDGVGVWRSQDISIAGLDLVQVSVDIRGSGWNLDWDDCIRLYYRIDGGSETQFYSGCNDLGTTYQTVSVSGLSGSTVQIIIRANNNADAEYYYWDNVTVTGIPMGSLPWPEDFPQSSGATQDMGTTAWMSSRSSGPFSVQSNQMCIWGAGAEAVWMSHRIDISGETSVDISLDLWSSGGMESGSHSSSASDWFYVYYVIDGGSEQLMGAIDGRTPGPDPLDISVSGLSGNTLQLVVRTRTTASDERYCFDNINIASTGPTAVPTIPPTAGPTPTPTIAPTPLPTLTPPTGSDDPPSTYCGCTPGSMLNPWAVGKPPGLRECQPSLLDSRSAGFEGNFNNVFPPWVAGPVVGSWLRQSVEHYPGDPSNSLRLATTLGVLPSCSPFPDPYLYQTITIPSTEVYTQSTLVVSGQILVRPPESSAENQCCRNTADDPTATADGDDSLYVQMQDAGGTPLAGGNGIEIATGGTTPGFWQSFSADVTSEVDPFSRVGQDIRLNIHGVQGDSDDYCTYFFLDALECELCTYWPPPPIDPAKASFGGLVTVVQQGRPQWLRGVDVYAYSPNGTFQHTQTIQDGSYHFYNLPTGTYTIYAIYQDDRVNAQTMSVAIDLGDRSDLHFVLFTSD